MQAETRTHTELAQFIMHVHDTRQWGRNKLSYGKGRPKLCCSIGPCTKAPSFFRWPIQRGSPATFVSPEEREAGHSGHSRHSIEIHECHLATAYEACATPAPSLVYDRDFNSIQTWQHAIPVLLS